MKILVSGASWSTGTKSRKPGFAWPTQVGIEMNAEIKNTAMDGASIDHVVRNIIVETETADYDYIVATIPVLTNRYELLARNDADNKYTFIPMHGIPDQRPFGVFISNKKINGIINDWNTSIANDYQAEMDANKNIILLGQYLKETGIKHIITYDLKPNTLTNLEKCTKNTATTLERFKALAGVYVSPDDYLSLYLDDMFLDKTLHPSDEGHILLGKKIAQRLRNL